MTQLPAHLQNRQQSLVGRAADGMGGLLPPHISMAHLATASSRATTTSKK